jgi:hypothetical protein
LKYVANTFVPVIAYLGVIHLVQIFPSTHISPPVGLTNPETRFKRVDLPFPEGPAMVMNSPKISSLVANMHPDKTKCHY